MTDSSFDTARALLPRGDWYFSHDPGLVDARARFAARLERSGIHLTAWDILLSERMSCVADHASMLSAVADMSHVFAGRLENCDPNALLEAAAAFFGKSSWDALSASLPRVADRFDTAGKLRKRGFQWYRTGGSLLLGGNGDEPEGWLWCRVEAFPEREGLAPPYVNVAAFREGFLEGGVPETPPDADGRVVVEVCRDAEDEDYVVTTMPEALDAIDRRLYLDRPAWVAFKRSQGTVVSHCIWRHVDCVTPAARATAPQAC
jgi:hypothetical protein